MDSQNQDNTEKVFKIALCQIMSSTDKAANLKRAGEMIREAAKNGAKVIVLPEMFTCPYMGEYIVKEKELINEA